MAEESLIVAVLETAACAAYLATVCWIVWLGDRTE